MTFFESLTIRTLQTIVKTLEDPMYIPTNAEIYACRMWLDSRAPAFGEYWEDIDTDRRKEIEAWCAAYSVDVNNMIAAMRRP